MSTPDENVENGNSVLDILTDSSLLGLIFSREEIVRLLADYPPVTVEADCEVVAEGQAADQLCIPLSGEMFVSSPMADGESVDQSSLSPGRAFNLYSLLRSLPCQYALRSRDEVELLRLPWVVIQPRLAELPTVFKYLLRMTESSDFQALALDVNQAECSQQFRIAFIAGLVVRSVHRQAWIVGQDQVPQDAFMLVRGEMIALKRTNENERRISARWQVPQRVWMLWKEVADGRLSSSSMRTLTEVVVYSASRASIEALKANFPKDYARWTQWLSRSSISGVGKDENEVEQELDLDQVLEETKFKGKKWQPYPWVQQNDQMDCGAACLTMVSQFFGKKFSIQYWRNQLSTDRDGTSAFDMCKTAEKNGFISHALWAESIDDIPQSALPVIVLRKFHYLVLYKKTKTHVVVGDPAIGIRKLTHAVFSEDFEKAYILIRPTRAFHELEVKGEQTSQLWSLLMHFRSELVVAFLSSLLLVAASVLPPVITQGILDDVLGSKDQDLLKICLFALVGYTAFNAFMAWARSYFLNFVAIKLDFLTKTAFIQRLMQLPYNFFAARHVGDFTRRLHEFETVRSFVTEKSLSFALSLVSLVIYMFVLFSYSLKIGAAVIALAPVFVTVSMLFTRRLISRYSTYFEAQAREDGFVSDLIRGMLAVKVTGSELAMRRRYEMCLSRSLNERYEFRLASVALQGLVGLIFEFSKHGMLGLAVYLAIRDELTAGQVVAISMLVVQVLTPFQMMALHWADFQEAKLVISRLNDVFLTAPESGLPNEVNHVRGQTRKNLTGKIEFRDVWFRYGGESSDWVLKGVSFSISAGEKIAIVGASGSGKSTIAMLINRIYLPQKGQILIDGKDHREYDLGWLRQQVGLVSQESFLFPGSVVDNIAIAGERADDESLMRAALVADAHDFIEKKPGGYTTYIPPGGHGFSGGEKQRLALARVLHRNPSLLVLDEATAALDGITERNFLNRINQWGSRKTIVSIAHRHSTVVQSRVVLILSDGRVAGIGSPAMLAEGNELFQQLFGIVPQNHRHVALEDENDDDEESETELDEKMEDDDGEAA